MNSPVPTNGTATAGESHPVSFPIKEAEIALDEIGYVGWRATVRLNPRSSVYDQLLSGLEDGTWWEAFGQIVLAWNFVDEQGHALPVPSGVASERELDLPVGVLTFLFMRYLKAVQAAADVPKGPDDTSSSTSRISDESRARA